MRILSYGNPSILSDDRDKFTLMAGKRKCNDCGDCDDCRDYNECTKFSMCYFNTNPYRCNWYDANKDD